LLAVSLLCVWAGGYAFLLLLVAACVVLSGEWVTMCGYVAPDWPVFWVPAVTVAASLCAGFGAAWAGLLLVVLGTVVAVVGSSLTPSPPTQGLETASAQACYGLRTDAAREPRPREPKTREIVTGSDDVALNSSAGRPMLHKFELAFGLPYLGLAAVTLPWLRADPEVGLRNTLFVLSIVWASDIGAYMIGRLVGGPKLAPAISPGKTWSGAAGGLLGAVLAGTSVAAFSAPEISAFRAIGPAIVLGVVSQSGDLLESALKRHFGVKDSGRIIPGHGGLLDRLDALLAVAPVAALLALTVGRGVVLWR
jgi:phosphatidate cytidylyltransferase